MFSVIVPTYNRNDFAIRAVASALNSEYLIQIIVVDTNLKRSPKFVEDLQRVSSKIEYIYLGQANGSIARNFGAKFAKHEWLLFLDDDDVFLPHKYKILVQKILAESDCCCFVSGSLVRNSFYSSTSRICSGSHLSIFEHIVDDHKFNSSCLVIKRSLFIELKGFDEALVRKQDFDFILRILLKSKIRVIDADLQLLDKSDRQNLPGVYLFLLNQVVILNKYLRSNAKSGVVFALLLSEFLTSFLFLSIRKKSLIALLLAVSLNLCFLINLPFLCLSIFRKMKRYLSNYSHIN